MKLWQKNDKDQHFNYRWLKFNIYKVIMNKRFNMIGPSKNYINDFSKKVLLGKWVILVPKPKNDAMSLLWIPSNNFFLVLDNGRVHKVHENLITVMAFPKKFFGGSAPFWTQKWHTVITLEQLYEFFVNFVQSKGQGASKVYYIMVYRKKFSFQAIGPFWPQ